MIWKANKLYQSFFFLGGGTDDIFLLLFSLSLTVFFLFPSLYSPFLPLVALITRWPRAALDGPRLYYWHTVPPPFSSCGASARAGARTQPFQATTSQIWRDEAHVATDKPLWSISWMHSESVERKALKIKPCPWCAQQWLCGQRCQRQPANIKELGAAGLSVLNTN